MPQHIYQSKGRIFFGFLSVSIFTGAFLFFVYYTLQKHGLPISFDSLANIPEKDKGTTWSLLALGLLGIPFAIKALLMLVNSGKPIATIDSSGITPRNGKTLVWDDIEDIVIESMAYTFVTLRSDLAIYLANGKKKKIPYVSLTQEKLADMIEEAHKG